MYWLKEKQKQDKKSLNFGCFFLKNSNPAFLSWDTRGRSPARAVISLVHCDVLFTVPNANPSTNISRVLLINLCKINSSFGLVCLNKWIIRTVVYIMLGYWTYNIMAHSKMSHQISVLWSLLLKKIGGQVAQWVRSLDLATHTSLSPIRHGFAPGFVNYKKGCTWLAAASDKIYKLLAHGRWFSSGIAASSTTKTGCHDIAEIL